MVHLQQAFKECEISDHSWVRTENGIPIGWEVSVIEGMETIAKELLKQIAQRHANDLSEALKAIKNQILI